MSAVDEHEREPGGDDMLAAEYVLGVLPAAERADAARRIETDAAFARLVDAWELHLSPLGEAYAPVEPPAALREAVQNRLFGQGAPKGTPAGAGGLWASLAFWRGLTVAALAALALYVAIPLMTPPAPETPDARLVASLGADGSDVRYVALYDAGEGKVGLSHLSGDRAAGRDFELWVIEGDNPPRSLGVIPVGSSVALGVPEDERRRIAGGAVFAISLEPQGGSPTGAPTGPVVAAGDLRDI